MTVVVIEPHPDDCFLGCYSLLKLGMVDRIITVSKGDIVPKKLQSKYTPQEFSKIRFEETRDVCKRFGVCDFWLDYPDGKLSEQKTAMGGSAVAFSISQLLHYDNVVFIPSSYEKHPDHLFINKIFRELSFRVKGIMEYAVNSYIPDYTTNMTSKVFPFKMKEFFEFYPSQKGYPISTLVKEEYFKVIK
jgi:LmbE family N-acetylglucosaminyl deacetylase